MKQPRPNFVIEYKVIRIDRRMLEKYSKLK